jgi:hypothetical protein
MFVGIFHREGSVAYIGLKTDLGHHFVNSDHIVQVMTSVAGNKWTVVTTRQDQAGSIAITDVESIEKLKEVVGI